MTFTRRFISGLALAPWRALFGASARRRRTKCRIGFQKYGNLILPRQRMAGKEAEPARNKVEWKEFPSGPPLLEH